MPEATPTADTATDSGEAVRGPPDRSPSLTPLDFRIPFAVGMLVTLAGAFWDAWRHLNGQATDESFWNPFLNPAHGMIYGGAVVMAASLVLLWRGTLTLPLSVGMRTKATMAVGIATLLGGGLYDFWWHNTFGFADTTPWTPSHLTATAGFLVLLVSGVVNLSRNSRWAVKALFGLSLLLFASLWTMVVLLT